MANKTTLDDIASMLAKQGKAIGDLGDMLGHVVKSVGDIERKVDTVATSVTVLTEQVTGIEGQLRSMRHTKLEARVADLEEKVFGDIRA